MAQHDVSLRPRARFVNKAKATAGSVTGTGAGALTTPANYDTNAAMDARLIAIDSVTFTQARLDSMTDNDKIFAIRTLDDPGTL